MLVVGLSTRAMAASAAEAALDVTAIDAFADRDQHRGVRALSVAAGFSARSVERAARSIEADAVAYTSPFENHPLVIAALARGRTLWGNGAGVLRRVRDPYLVGETLRRRGFRFPELHDPRSAAAGAAAVAGLRVVRRGREATGWLVKPARSGGGNGIRPWRVGGRVPRGACVQRFVEGVPWSVAFVASPLGVVPLGLSRQLIGDPAFGAAGFRYCGSIVDPGSEALRARTAALAGTVVEEFGLVGVNGIDFIRQDDEPVAIEVNPRWSGSMELLERAYGWPMFRVHAEACAAGTLPPSGAAAAERVHGKAIVFARQTVTLGDTTAWLEDGDIRDVPQSGERIAAGRPVCTVFAAAADGRGCYAGLAARAAAIDAQLARWRRSVA